ncbi:MAG: hypothetical protein ACR2MB_02835 [Acidimicrobiales bacterium]
MAGHGPARRTRQGAQRGARSDDGNGRGTQQPDLARSGAGPFDLAAGAGQEPGLARVEEQVRLDQFEQQRFENLALPFQDHPDALHPVTHRSSATQSEAFGPRTDESPGW